ncbi:hypothetical protein [Burkholderia thailandensis]|nr:hypothetical protein [Burkholderia thailandensis]MCS3396681.1 hypothetical protein [Burkholderia thailandensis]MCS6475908.1 hypothetical protein [Burkholderia thailandensis]MCS6497052.1 hypothetical protein [Burkholderia thailandensis]MCS6499485.1 hypothetical protein [Burkholderia thailandensis]MCS6505570.1 hypothetical protein [Burkholderia thailandensis]
MNQSSEVHPMSHSPKVASLMLEFASLPEEARREFLVLLNNFIFLSPAARRKTQAEWKRIAAMDRLPHSGTTKR